MKQVSFAVLLLVLCVQASAAGEDLSKFLGRASAVAVVYVASGTNEPLSTLASGCGHLYTGYVLEEVQSLREGEKVSFRARAGLMIGGVYLLFLTDQVDPQADASSIIKGIRASKCAESGVDTTVMKIGSGGDVDLGAEAILEQRREPNEDALAYKQGQRVLFGNRAFNNLLDGLSPTALEDLKPRHYDLQRADFIARGILYEYEELLELLSQEGVSRKTK